jgi:hypothetical protein
MKDYIAQARVVPPGFRSTSDWAMDWRGAWVSTDDTRVYFGEYKTGQVGDSVSFTFSGTDLDLVALQNPYGGAVSVQIDDQSFDSAAAPLRAGSARAIELWHTDSGAGGRISLARDLDSGVHRVTITVTRAPVAINGFIVQSGNAWIVKRVAVVGVLASLLVGWFVIGRRRARINADKT